MAYAGNQGNKPQGVKAKPGGMGADTFNAAATMDFWLLENP